MARFKLIAGNANRGLAEQVARKLGVRLIRADIGKFPNGETRVEILESVRKNDVMIIQPTCPPVNDNLMELFLIIDALKRASCGFITLIIPYYGYSKQDKKKTGREPISAKMVADMLETLGVRRIVTLDLHAAQIEGFFNIPVDNLTAINMMAEYFRRKKLRNIVVVAPDTGGVKRARDMANAMNANRIAIIDKYRPDYRKATAMNVVGKVKGMNAVIIDDFIDTGGSMVEAVKAVKNHGANRIWVACTHPLLTKPATERLRQLKEVEEFVFTDTIPIPKEKMFGRIRVLTIADMISDVIKRLTSGQSLEPYRVKPNTET